MKLFGLLSCKSIRFSFCRFFFSFSSSSSSSRCLRTIAQYNGADEHLCYSKTLPDKLKDIREKWTKSTDIQEEAKALWYIIHRNVKPGRVHIDECRTTTANISWNLNIKNWNDQDLNYRVILSKN